MGDPASVDHDRAAGILADIEANANAAIQDVETNVMRGEYTYMTVEIAIKSNPNTDDED